MLGRQINPLFGSLSAPRNETLEKCLSSVLPATRARAIDRNLWLPIGHHLVYFNPYVLEDDLLPDGTDAIHSPGPPFNRRLWAGGRLNIDVAKYFTGPSAWKLGTPFVCLERITNVHLRGEHDAAKIFITIQRRFASIESLDHYRSGLAGRKQTVQDAALLDGFRNELVTEDDWGSASMIEERDIVFLKDRTQDELDAFIAGDFPPVRYLKCMFFAFQSCS
jgi:hypothetical protein